MKQTGVLQLLGNQQWTLITSEAQFLVLIILKGLIIARNKGEIFHNPI